MKMSIEKFNERVTKFIWDVVIPDADDIPTKCVFGGIEKSRLLVIEGKNTETLAALNIVDDEKSVDVDQLRVVLYGAAEAGGGVIAFKKGFFTVRVPRPMIDKFFKYIETGTVQ